MSELGMIASQGENYDDVRAAVILSKKLTKRMRAVLLVIGAMIWRTRANRCTASQSFIGKEASKHGWKEMDRRMVNEVIGKLTKMGVLEDNKQSTFKGSYSTRKMILTDLGNLVYAALINEPVDNTLKNQRKNNVLRKTGHGEIKNRTLTINIEAKASTCVTIKHNLNKRADPVDKKVCGTADQDSMFFLLTRMGVGENDALKFEALVKSYNHTEEDIRKATEATWKALREKTVHNVRGYLTKILKALKSVRQVVEGEKKQAVFSKHVEPGSFFGLLQKTTKFNFTQLTAEKPQIWAETYHKTAQSPRL